MIRSMLIGFIALFALAGGAAVWLQRRESGRLGEHDAVQWPFDSAELRSLMSRAVAEQRERISAIEDKAGRDRANAFLEYYERRRQAVAS